jgi:hypothetical protein
MQWVFAGGPILIAFLGNLVIVGLLLRNLFALKQQMRRLSTTWNRVSMTTKNPRSLLEAATLPSEKSTLPLSRRFWKRISLSRGGRDTNNQKTMRNSCDDKMRYHLQVQASLYTIAFLFVYLFPIMNRTIIMVTGSVPPYMLLLSRTINPLQGFFNMIIYTRIPVSELRSKSDLSWLAAFWVVVRCREGQFVSTKKHISTGKSNRQYRRFSLQTKLRHAMQQIDDDQDNDHEKINNTDQENLPIQYDESFDSYNTKENHLINLLGQDDETNHEGKEIEFSKEMIERRSNLQIMDEVETNSCVSNAPISEP